MTSDEANDFSPSWPRARVGDVAEVYDGPHATPTKTLTGPVFLGISALNRGRLDLTNTEHLSEDEFAKWTRRVTPRDRDVVFSYETRIGEAAIIPPGLRCCLGRRMGLVRTDPSKLDPHFFLYQYLSPTFQEFLRSRTIHGSTVDRIALKEFPQFEIDLPPLVVQRQVAKVMLDTDAKIDLNCRINKTLEAMAQAIFKSWFVDFDPVKSKIAAKQEGRDPLRAAMSAISGKNQAELDALPVEQHDQLAATAALFPDEMEESELGEVPKGWACGALGDICSFTAGSAFKPEHQGSTEGDYPFIKVSDMNLAGNEVFIQSANNYVSKAQQSEMKAKLHPLGATVFAKIGVALISNRRRLLTSPTIIDNNLMSASPVKGKSGQYFLYSLLSTLDFNTLVSGTALPYINVSDLKKIPIVRPPSDACRAFEAKASSVFSMMQILAAQSSTLATTRNALLPKLLSGEIEASGTFEG
jgi:type I restriction enzyme S subunit